MVENPLGARVDEKKSSLSSTRFFTFFLLPLHPSFSWVNFFLSYVNPSMNSLYWVYPSFPYPSLLWANPSISWVHSSLSKVHASLSWKCPPFTGSCLPFLGLSLPLLGSSLPLLGSSLPVLGSSRPFVHLLPSPGVPLPFLKSSSLLCSCFPSWVRLSLS